MTVSADFSIILVDETILFTGSNGESMSDSAQEPLRRVLIASANPLFARGLQKMVAQRWEGRGVEFRIAESMEEAAAVLEDWQPNFVIVDYDDHTIHRAAFLSHFISGDRPMQVMLVSLRASGEVVVYDRRTLTPAQAEDWLDLSWAASPDFTLAAEQTSAVPNAVTTISDTKLNQRSGGMKHYVYAGVLVAIVTVLTYLALQAVGLLPVAASVQAGPIDRMVYMQLWLISFLFSLIVVFIGYSVVVFRQRKGENKDGVYFKGSTRLEVLWTLFPLIAVIYLSFLGAQSLGEVRRVDTNAMDINVIAFQWGWIYEYPDYDIQSNVLYMPVDRQARLLLTSRDVIHSFWVPEFRVKQDALPGRNLVKELRVTPNLIGEYTNRCAELCGGAHAYMNSPVRVVSQADFDAWVDEQTGAADLSPAERGERLSRGTGCLACHSLDGTPLAGPTWLNLYGSEIQLADGNAVIATDQYLYDAIVDPNAQIHAGYPPIMPTNYEDTLTEQQIWDIVEFIKTIQ
jgi:cytochrome c oxidase subunit II